MVVLVMNPISKKLTFNISIFSFEKPSNVIANIIIRIDITSIKFNFSPIIFTDPIAKTISPEVIKPGMIAGSIKI